MSLATPTAVRDRVLAGFNRSDAKSTKAIKIIFPGFSKDFVKPAVKESRIQEGIEFIFKISPINNITCRGSESPLSPMIDVYHNL